MTNKDPSREPVMVEHYVGQAITFAGSCDEEIEEIEGERVLLISKLKKCIEDDSPHTKLKKKMFR